jgi:hypothetical protein
MNGAIIAIAIALAIVALATSGAWQRSAKDQAHAQIASECIKQGKRYHETIFTHNPVCK